MRCKECFLTFKVLELLLLSLLLLSFLLISGCTPISNLLFGPSGSIEVTTYPSGAKIFLNDKDTGYVTPYTITNLTKDTYEIMVVLGDISYTETVTVYSSKTTDIYIELMPPLYKIVAQPSYMNLKEGESRAIDSITAFYLNSGSKDINPSACSFSSNSNHATVNSSGIVTGISDGPATITVSYTDAEITKTTTVSVYVGVIQISPPVSNPIVYRAFCVGVGDYIEGSDNDLLSPPYDVDRMVDVFNHCKFGTEEVNFSSITSLKDLSATKAAIMSGIASAFSGADDTDVSYFYFSGHGDWGLISTSYICPTNSLLASYDNDISVNELEVALSAIPGTKVVILDSCYSGGFIGKGKEEKIISKENLASFNDEIIDVFSQVQFKGLLTTNQYKVLTSCHYYQSCMGIQLESGDPFGLFTKVLCDGCGYDGNYYADIANDNDTRVTLDEAYEFVKEWVPYYESIWDIDNRQDVQVFPENSIFTIVEH